MRLLVYLFSFFLFSQEQTAKGFVLDKETDKVIPYVNISILETQTGTSSDDDGSYKLTINSQDLDKKVHISSLGYKDTTLTVSSFVKLKAVFLNPVAEELDEVVVSNKFEEEFLRVKPFSKKDLYGGFGMGKKPWQIGLYFPFDSTYLQTAYINKITILLSKDLGFKRKASKFRVRLLSISQDSLPLQDLIKEGIIVTASKKQKVVEVDISKYDIDFPENGIFVVLEGLAIPFNEIERTYTMIDVNGEKSKIKKETGYVPSFKAFLSEPNKFLVVHYGNGKWWKHKLTHPENNKTFVPAISLTLSN
jgi:hypothetical protein